jgi:hypothetical protein
MARYDGLALFMQRARAVQPDFQPTADNGLAIVNICRQLDGLPLAIELAAARLKILSPEALLGRLTSRLDMLVGGARDQPARLRGMRATIEWSYELLEPGEQVLFEQLAVFAGGFSLDAAEAVCANDDAVPDVLTGISALVDASLIVPQESPCTEPRFKMLETIREFGLEQLAARGREHEKTKGGCSGPTRSRCWTGWNLNMTTCAPRSPGRSSRTRPNQACNWHAGPGHSGSFAATTPTAMPGRTDWCGRLNCGSPRPRH